MSYSELVYAYKVKYNREAKQHRFKSGMLINVSNLTNTYKGHTHPASKGIKWMIINKAPRGCQGVIEHRYCLALLRQRLAILPIKTVNQLHTCQLTTALINLLNVLQQLITYISDLKREGSKIKNTKSNTILVVYYVFAILSKDPYKYPKQNIIKKYTWLQYMVSGDGDPTFTGFLVQKLGEERIKD